MSAPRYAKRAALVVIAVTIGASLATYAASLNVSSDSLTAFGTSTSLATTSTTAATTSSTTASTTPVTQTFLVELVVPGTQTAGVAFDLRLTARDNGSTSTSYNGPKTISWTAPASPNNTAASFPSSVTFTNGVSTSISSTVFKAGSAVPITAADGARSGELAISIDPALLGFTQTTFNGQSQSCSPTTAIDTRQNNKDFVTRVNVKSTDAYGNTKALVGNSTVSVNVALSGSAPNHFSAPHSATLTVPLPATPNSPPYTSSNAFTVKRSNANAIPQPGGVTASSAGYGSTFCQLG